MTSVLYLGCPAPERADTEKQLSTADVAVVSFAGRSGWLVDLRGYPQSPFEGSFPLRPFGIATARLHGA